MGSFREILNAWPSDKALAQDLGVAVSHARTIKARDFVPARYWRGLVGGAEARGIAGVTYERLAALAAERVA